MKTSRPNLLKSGMLICSLPIWVLCQTDIFMKIHPTTFRAVRLSLTEFTCDSRPEIASEVKKILTDDLNYTGLITIVPNTPEDSTQLAAQIDMVAEASFSVTSEKVICDLNVKETLSGWKVLNKRFNHSLSNLRQLAHTMADEIVLRLTGELGIATTKIAFIKEIGGFKELALMDYDGANQRVLTNQKAILLSPDWEPEGKLLVLSSLKPSLSLNAKISFYNLNNGQLTFVDHLSVPASSPAFSPDGKKIVFTLTQKGNADLYLSDWKASNPRRLTQDPAIDTDPSWSPNGKSLAFTSDRSGSPQIYIMDADGANVRRLTYLNNYNASPVWSPRGDWIAYVSQEEGRFQIYIISPDGENVQRVTDGNASYENPSWAPDGQHLVFASNRTGKWEIYSVNIDGSQLKRLTFSGNNTQPSWSPRMKD